MLFCLLPCVNKASKKAKINVTLVVCPLYTVYSHPDPIMKKPGRLG
jgi:hypothetical protein